ncbi:MAG: TIGR04283 family arsenosugar biosynthesis glycosyltransferase [Acidobacteria bacterium]|nr:TIGR04283 family arsenosugar biosynthesis glycosyltransferase [Acidobacteriota bacterium]
MVSIIIPTYNEESTLEALLQQLRAQGAREILVADGSSTDATVSVARRYAGVVESPPNRGLQLNRAARQAGGDILLFLHADVRLPAGALAAVEWALSDPRVVGGSFSLEFTGDGFPGRVFTRINHWRRFFGIFYGDSGIFVRRAVFERLGGFREWPVLEDYEFARRLVKAGRTVCLRERLAVSSRRWQGTNGRGGLLWRTMAAWFFIQTLFLLGVPAAWLARWYPPVRRELN